MMRGTTVIPALLVVCVLVGCEKKSGSTGGGASPATDPGPAPEKRREPSRGVVGQAKRAAEACAEGARPDRSVSKEQFDVSVKAPASAKVGEAVEAEITVSPKSGYKINLKYPSELSLKPGSDGVSIPKKSFEKSDAKELSEARLRFTAAFTATAAGTRTIVGELGFSVCTPKICITEPDFCVAWEVAAQ